jgi:hypothetical protein
VPRQNRFRGGSQRSSRNVRREPINSDDGGTVITTTTSSPKGSQRRIERRTPIATGGSETNVTVDDQQPRQRRGFSPPKPLGKIASVGLLEAEFLGCIFLLILFLFADLSKSFPDKMMQTMKRGTFISILFFVLALVAGTGDNVGRVAKAIGGLTFFAMLLTSPMTEILGNMDTFFKGDWTSTNEGGTSATAGTPEGSTFSQLPSTIQSQIEGLPVFSQFSGIPGGAKDVIGFLNGLGSATINKIKGAL